MRLVEVSLDANDAYYPRPRRGSRLLWKTVVPTTGREAAGLRTVLLPVKPAVTCNRIEVVAGDGDRHAAPGCLRLR